MAASPTFFRIASMAALARQAAQFGIVHDTSLASVTVPVPSLVFGALFLQHWPLREQPGGAQWQEPAYVSYAPWVFTLPHALIHSSAGIVCIGDYVVAETLAHTDPVLHAYTPQADGIWIDTQNTPSVGGTQISVLSGSADSYYHALLDGLGRLSVVLPEMLTGAMGLLTTADRPSTVTWLQDRVCDQWRLRRTNVPERGNLRVERLVLAAPNDTGCHYHPKLAEWFASMAANADATPSSSPKRFFIDRRNAATRPLRNETAVIEALEPLGIESVALEHLSAQAQIALFRNAELVVAPHGAGLANLLFAKPGCRVIELQMDAYCHWGFRRLAALRGLAYDCVVGRALGRWPDLAGPIHGASWEMSVPHVVAAVQAASRPG